MRAAVEHGSRRRARTCGLTIFQSLYFVYFPYISYWKMGVVASATTRFSWVRKRFLSGMWPWRNSHPGGGSLSWAFKLRGASGHSAPVSCVASFATNAECSPRWCLSSGGLLSLCPPLCRSWLLSFFLGTVSLGLVWSSYHLLQRHVFPPLRDSGVLHLGLNR